MNEVKEFFIFKGWRFEAPFYCFYCGSGITVRQWAFARACGSCDVGKVPQAERIFAGPHFPVPTIERYFLESDRMCAPPATPLKSKPKSIFHPRRSPNERR